MKNLTVVSLGFLFAAWLMIFGAADFFGFVETHDGFSRLSGLASGHVTAANIHSVELIAFTLICLGMGLLFSTILFQLVQSVFVLIYVFLNLFYNFFNKFSKILCDFIERILVSRTGFRQ